MAYENNNAAYDLSLFDDEVYTSAAPARELEDEPVRKVKKKQKTKIVEFSEDDINKARRRKHNPVKLIIGGL